MSMPRQSSSCLRPNYVHVYTTNVVVHLNDRAQEYPITYATYSKSSCS